MYRSVLLNKSNFDVRANFTSDCSSYDKSDRIRERAAQAGQLGLLSLKDKRTKLDLIQTYKILKGIDTIDQNTWFSKVGFDATRLTRLQNITTIWYQKDQDQMSGKTFSQILLFLIGISETLNIFWTLLDIGRLLTVQGVFEYEEHYGAWSILCYDPKDILVYVPSNN